MKSFGIRLAFGAITILCGAYAAALAQKETSKTNAAFSETLPPLGQQATPLSGDGSVPDGFGGALQLVQHVEDSTSKGTDQSHENSGPDYSLGGSTSGVPNLPDSKFSLPNSKFSLPGSSSQGSDSSSEANRASDDSKPLDPPSLGDLGAPQSLMSQAPPSDLKDLPSSTTKLPALGAMPENANGPAIGQQDIGNTMSEAEPPGIPNSIQDLALPSGMGTSATPGADSLQGMNSNAMENSLRSGFSDASAIDTGNYPKAQTQDQAPATVGSPSTTGGSPNQMGTSPNQMGMSGQPMPGQPMPGMTGNTLRSAPASNAAGGPGVGAGNNFAVGNPAPAGNNNYNTAGQSLAAPSLNGSRPLNPNMASPAVGYPNAGRPMGGGGNEYAVAPASLEVDPSTIYNEPGDRRLEGMQTPSIVLQKRAPAEVQVNREATFVLEVKNVGSAEAMDVKVHDRVPAGMRLVDATPEPVINGDMLLWSLGTLPAGSEQTVTMRLIPTVEGELGSVARVTFEAAASVRTLATRPELKIIQTAPPKVMIGGQVEIELEISNPGTGRAVGVIVQEDVPEGFEHHRGRQIDSLIGDLAPGEIRRERLQMRAVAAGQIENYIRVTSEDGITADSSVTIDVISPQLQLAIQGPSRRYLERPATYQVDLVNVGTADATNLQIAVQLDPGMTFVSTENQGQYDSSRHTVYWSLAALPAGQRGSIPLTVLPVKEGMRAMRGDAKADLDQMATITREIQVDAYAELDFQIAGNDGPIELGSQTEYEIRVRNSGTAQDSNVKVALQLPPGLELVETDSAARSNGGQVIFSPRSQMAPGGEAVFRVAALATAPGNHIVKAIVVSDKQQVAVSKEESTVVYSDQ